jgi:hypothetical protein
MNRVRYLVDVLAAGALRPDRGEFDFVERDERGADGSSPGFSGNRDDCMSIREITPGSLAGRTALRKIISSFANPFQVLGPLYGVGNGRMRSPRSINHQRRESWKYAET